MVGRGPPIILDCLEIMLQSLNIVNYQFTLTLRAHQLQKNGFLLPMAFE